MTKPFVFDYSGLPDLVIITNTGPATDAEFEQYLEETERNLQKNAHFTVIFDAQTEAGATPAQRLRQSQWMNANRNLCAERIVHFAFVIRSSFVGGLLRAIFLFAKPPYPYVVVKTLEDAKRSCKVALATATTKSA